MDCLVRYGVIPEVARCRVAASASPARGGRVVIQSPRGPQLGAVVEVLADRRTADAADPVADSADAKFVVLRDANEDDLSRQHALQAEAESAFAAWGDRIRAWNLDLQLIDLEWTLDRAKLVLYVLNERGPECTKLAIQAAAAGLGIVDVQPVSAEGIVSQPTAGGCGTCGCRN